MRVPRKRAELEREEKVEEILQRAVDLLRSGGDDDLTINRVATDVGVARAAVYWYFPSRDELFVAAAARIFATQFADVPARAGDVKQIEWAVDRLADIYDIYASLQQRAAHLPAAADLLEGFQRTLCDALKVLLAPRVEADRLQDVADTIVMFVEGLLGRRLSPRARRRHLRFALAAVLGDEGGTDR